MKFTSILFSLLLTSFFSSAQIERKPSDVNKDSSVSVTTTDKKMNKQNRKERIKDLNLTKEQRIKMKSIRQSGQGSKQAIENNVNLTEAEKKKQLRALQIEQAQKVQLILTEEQKEKFKADRQDKQ